VGNVVAFLGKSGSPNVQMYRFSRGETPAGATHNTDVYSLGQHGYQIISALHGHLLLPLTLHDGMGV
jgi:hypothetical protein